jgi:hypothetical protein
LGHSGDSLVKLQSAPANKESPGPGKARAVVPVALLYYLLTSLVVVLAILGAFEWVLPPGVSPAERPPLLLYFAPWDGQAYKGIVEQGYSYQPGLGSNVAFFPAYPLLAWLLRGVTGCPSELALVLTSHLCLAGAFVLMALYLKHRLKPDETAVFHFTLLALGLFPSTFFFRVAYSESLLVLVTALTLYAFEARWSLVWIAVIVGAATAVRPVGLAFVVPFALHAWQRSVGPIQFAVSTTVLVPLACWGMLAYLLYQAMAFNDPFAFAHSQMIWHMRPATSLADKLLALVTLRPFWENFISTSPCSMGARDPVVVPFFSLYVANPIFFALAILFLVVGAWKRWLSSCEIALAAALLFIPYVTRSHEMCMVSGGRFASVVLPTYLVLGHVLARLPRGVAILGLAGSAALLAIYSARFALGHAFFY